jgi:hypothetical protein
MPRQHSIVDGGIHFSHDSSRTSGHGALNNQETGIPERSYKRGLCVYGDSTGDISKCDIRLVISIALRVIERLKTTCIIHIH